eukprot:TRINITY_DN2735_c0_g1_i1.p1 TRINITY_DN2735_c0_g1~~TRINITY_DN2735_c0_g1_i1.p1  ORF type:complete len:342 (+),score=103.14 TRINITY_DN2735_c0_g1_i1:30-1055(+)
MLANNPIGTAFAGLGVGTLFGGSLAKSGVLNPDVIKGQFQLTNFTMAEVLLAAIGTGSVSIGLAKALGLKAEINPFRPTSQIIGGLMLGSGVALSGSCPGSIFGQLGSGVATAPYALMGSLAGGLTFSLIEPKIRDWWVAQNKGTPSIPEIVGVPLHKLSAPVLILCALLIIGMRKSFGKGKIGKGKGMPPFVPGAFLGLLHMPLMAFFSKPVGSSSAFITVLNYVMKMFGMETNEYMNKYNKGWWQVFFDLGGIIGGFLSAYYSGRLSGSKQEIADVWQKMSAFIGGFLMLFGSRLAMGCTSGHALSGTAQLAVSAFPVVGSLMAGGCATAAIRDSIFKK